MSIVVDLPAPFGPSSATVSPGGDREVDAAHRAHRARGTRKTSSSPRSSIPPRPSRAPASGDRVEAWTVTDQSVASWGADALSDVKPLCEPEDLFNAKILEVSNAAEKLGVSVGMTGREAVEKLLAAG